MNFSNEITLIVYLECQKNQNGFAKKEKYETTVFANRKSVGRTEFYSAMQAGINQNVAYDVWCEEFEESAYIDENGKKHYPSRIEDNVVEYNITRTYTKDGEILEINCSKAEE